MDEWIYPGKSKALRAKLVVKKQGLGFAQLVEKAEDAARRRATRRASGGRGRARKRNDNRGAGG